MDVLATVNWAHRWYKPGESLAVNSAMQKVVKSSAESLSQLQSSNDWKSAIGEVFRGGTAR